MKVRFYDSYPFVSNEERQAIGKTRGQTGRTTIFAFCNSRHKSKAVPVELSRKSGTVPSVPDLLGRFVRYVLGLDKKTA